jgi:hypothetical protein
MIDIKNASRQPHMNAISTPDSIVTSEHSTTGKRENTCNIIIHVYYYCIQHTHTTYISNFRTIGTETCAYTTRRVSFIIKVRHMQS